MAFLAFDTGTACAATPFDYSGRMTDDGGFRKQLAARARAFDAALDGWLSHDALPGEVARPARLVAAMRHGVLNGGKRIRPFLVVECAALLGASEDAALPVAGALECVHCYSLIHDDLPAMDDDDLRRGQPAVHRAFDEATAILAGDALLTLAFDLISRPDAGLAAERTVALVSLLARAAGMGGMAGGQMFDLEHEHGGADGAMIGFACEAGAVVAGADDDVRDRLGRFGGLIGQAFQLADDLLDVTADAATLGKATQKDAAAGKQTLVAIHGVDRTHARLDALVAEAIDLLSPHDERADALRRAAAFIAGRRS